MSPDQHEREGKPYAYPVGDIQLFHSLEHIRSRPGMYIGSADARGLHHLVEYLLSVPLEQARTRTVTLIEVELLGDAGCRVRDDGPGLSAEDYPQAGRDRRQRTIELLLTTLGSGYSNLEYPIANAVSERLIVEIARNGFFWRQEFQRGERVTDFQQGESTATTGTSFTFWPDPLIFNDARFDADRLLERLRELAFLNPGLTIRWIDSRTQPPVTEQFTYPNGLADYVRWLKRAQRLFHPTVFHFRETVEGETVEVAAQWIDTEDSREVSFANSIRTRYGGTHVTGFRTGVTEAMKRYLRTAQGVEVGDSKIIGEDFRVGMIAVIAVDLHEPQFSGSTRETLNNPEVVSRVSGAMQRHLAAFLQSHPDEARAILARVILERDARLAASEIRRQKRR